MLAGDVFAMGRVRNFFTGGSSQGASKPVAVEAGSGKPQSIAERSQALKEQIAKDGGVVSKEIDPLSLSENARYRSAKGELKDLSREFDRWLLLDAQERNHSKSAEEEDSSSEVAPQDAVAQPGEGDQASRSPIAGQTPVVFQPTYSGARLQELAQKLAAIDPKTLREQEKKRLAELKKTVEMQLLEPVIKSKADLDLAESTLRDAQRAATEARDVNLGQATEIYNEARAAHEKATKKLEGTPWQVRASGEQKEYTLAQVTANSEKIKTMQDKAMKALRNGPDGKLVDRMLTKEMQEILRSPKSNAEKLTAVKDYVEELQKLQGFDLTTLKDSKKLTKRQKSLIEAIEKMKKDGSQDKKEAKIAETIAEIDKFSGPQGSFIKNAIAKYAGCADWRMFKQARAFDKMIKHLNVDYLIGLKTPSELDAVLLPMKPVTEQQRALIESIRGSIREVLEQGVESVAANGIAAQTAGVKLKKMLNTRKQIATVRKIIVDNIGWVLAISALVAAVVVVSVLSFGAPEIAVGIAGVAAVATKAVQKANAMSGGKIADGAKGLVAGLGLVKAAKSIVDGPDTAGKTAEELAADAPRKAALRQRVVKQINDRTDNALIATINERAAFKKKGVLPASADRRISKLHLEQEAIAEKLKNDAYRNSADRKSDIITLRVIEEEISNLMAPLKSPLIAEDRRPAVATTAQLTPAASRSHRVMKKASSRRLGMSPVVSSRVRSSEGAQQQAVTQPSGTRAPERNAAAIARLTAVVQNAAENSPDWEMATKELIQLQRQQQGAAQ